MKQLDLQEHCLVTFSGLLGLSAEHVIQFPCSRPKNAAFKVSAFRVHTAIFINKPSKKSHGLTGLLDDSGDLSFIVSSVTKTDWGKTKQILFK